jgi:hypothetical protein
VSRRISRRRDTAARGGFALLGVLLLLIVVVAVAATVIGLNAATADEQFRVKKAEDFLIRLTAPKTGITLFRGDVNGKTPRALSQLSIPITTADQDLCGTFYSGTGLKADVDEWSGRYAGQVHPVSGTPIRIGTIRDTLELEPVGTGFQSVLLIEGVNEQEALRLDARVDGGNGSAAGSVRWTTVAADGTVTIRWIIPMPGGCNQRPNAAFTVSCTALTCSFTDGSSDPDGFIASWLWDFGDGASSTAQNPSRTYAVGGTYTVDLTVTDNEGATDTATQIITIRNFVLSATARRQGTTRWTDIAWSGALSGTVELYRNGVLVATLANVVGGNNVYVDPLPGAGTYTYQMCEAGTSICSNSVTTSIN